MISAKKVIAVTRKPDGHERIVKESLHYGVGDYAYTYTDDAKKAGLKEGTDYVKRESGCFVRLTDEGVSKFCHWLNTSFEAYRWR